MRVFLPWSMLQKLSEYLTFSHLSAAVKRVILYSPKGKEGESRKWLSSGNIIRAKKGGMEGREKGGTPFKIQCANAAAAVTREMKSGEQGVITMRGRGGKNEWKVAGGPYSAFSRIRYIMEERVMDRVYSLMWTLFLLDNVWLIFLCMQM